MKIYLVISAIILLVWGCLLPVSSSLIRYLRWRVTPASTGVHGVVATDDDSLQYVSYGKGPAILLLHGGLSNRLAWFSQIPWLVASGRQVVLPDTRGHGRSALGSKEMTYRLLANDVIRILDRLNIQKADVIGWSDGGNTALLLAQNHPERINRIITISANFNPSGLTPEALKDTRTQSSGPAYWITRWWTGAGKHLHLLEKRTKRMWRTFPRLQPADLHRITAPTLVIVGDHDIISTAHAKQMADALPNGGLKEVSSGHHSPITHPQLINRAIAAFLDLPSPP